MGVSPLSCSHLDRPAALLSHVGGCKLDIQPLSFPKSEAEPARSTPDKAALSPPSGPDSPKTFRKSLAGRAAAQARPRPNVADDPALTVAELNYYLDGWLVAGEASMHSPQTLAIRRLIGGNLLWFLRREGKERCGKPELMAFCAYLVKGHLEPGGRWGNPQMTRPVRPRTVQTYQGHLRTFFRWVVREGALDVSPMDRIDSPPCRRDQIQPFSADQVNALLSAARRTQNPARDEAIVWTLYDTGIRAAELCGLKRKDLDLSAKKITVLGKGNKTRSVYFGRRLARTLWSYLGQSEWDPEEPLFCAERSRDKGAALHRYGLRDLVERLGKSAQIEGVRCSAHTFRHTHALEYLRCGGSVEGLRERLGHENVKMTLKYVALAEADIAGQRRFSPGDQLKTKCVPTPRAKRLSPMERGDEVPRLEDATAPPGRAPMPQMIRATRVSEEDVRTIKRVLAEPRPAGVSRAAQRREVAQQYGISERAVKDLALGYTWGHVSI